MLRINGNSEKFPLFWGLEKDLDDTKTVVASDSCRLEAMGGGYYVHDVTLLLKKWYKTC